MCENNIKKKSKKKLDEIYIFILLQSINNEYNDQDKKKLLELFREIVKSIVILFNRFIVAILIKLLNKLKKNIDQTLNDLHSILKISNN